MCDERRGDGMGTFFSELAECEKVVIKDKYIENKAGEMVVFEKETCLVSSPKAIKAFLQAFNSLASSSLLS